MIDRDTEKQMQREQKYFGIANTFQSITPYPFGGMDQSTSRQGIKDNKFWYLENILPYGRGELLSIDDSILIFDSTGSLDLRDIVKMFFYTINQVDYIMMFDSFGAAIQTGTNGTGVTVIGTSNTFPAPFNSDSTVVCTQWGTKYVAMSSNRAKSAYWIWDGSVLFKPGSLGPQVTITYGGQGYAASTAPYLNLSAFGGSGTGATFTGTVTNGSLTNVVVTNPGSGYLPGEYVQLYVTGSNIPAKLTAVLTATTVLNVIIVDGGSGYTGTPTVAITGGGGAGATATLTQSGGVINGVTITAPGAGFTGTPIATVSGTGTGAVLQVVLTPTTVASVTIVTGGNGYVAPTLTITGGGGSGATATATVAATVINAVAVGAAGKGYTSTPAVIVNPGDNIAASGYFQLMPYGVSGGTIESYESRIFLGDTYSPSGVDNGGTRLVSAPSSLVDFATSDGALITVNSDPFLRKKFYKQISCNGYLYTIGDSSISVVQNVQTTGVPPTTTLNIKNVDPQVGTTWPDTVQLFGNFILFANPTGVYSLYGGTATKISDEINNLFIYGATNTTLFYPAANNPFQRKPSACVANIFGKKVYLLLMNFIDPLNSNATLSAMVAWDGKEWFVLNQLNTSEVLTGRDCPFSYITTQEVESNLYGWGTDGDRLYRMFGGGGSIQTKIISTKLYGNENLLIQKEGMGAYLQGSAATEFNVYVETENGLYSIPNNPVILDSPSGGDGSTPFGGDGAGVASVVSFGTGDVVGVNLGLTLTSASAAFQLNYMGIGNIEISSIAMSSTPLTGGTE